MEEAAVQPDAPEASDAQPAAGESGARPASPPRESGRSDLDNLIRGLVRQAPTSNPTAEESDGESTSQEGVKPSEGRQRQADGRFAPRPSADTQSDPPGEQQPLGRRAAAAEIDRLKQENDALKAQTDPATLRAQALADIEAENARAAAEAYDEDYLGEETLYQAAIRMPYGDPRLSELVPNGKESLWEWVEERRLRREKHPHVEAHYRTAYEQLLQADVNKLNQRQSAFWADVKGQMDRLASRKGVEQLDYAQLNNFEKIGDYLYDSGARSRDDEVAEIEAENRELRAELGRHASFNGPRGLGAGRAPVPAGRSSNGQASGTSQLDAFIRGRAPRP